MIKKIKSESGSTNNNSEFIKLSDEIAKAGEEARCKITPYFDPSLPHFSRLGDEQQKEIIEKLHFFRQCLMDTKSQGYNFSNSAQLVWVALKNLGFNIPGDFLDRIGQNHVVEIYDNRFLQVFCNFEFFNNCSYSIEQMSCFAWPELWHRRQEDMEKLIELSRAVVELGPDEVMTIGLQQEIEELHSPFKYKVKNECKFAAPVRRIGDKQVAGIIVIEECEILNPITSEEEEMRLLEEYDPILPHLDNIVRL